MGDVHSIRRVIAVTTIDGVLRIRAEVSIPNAPAGQWTAGRVGELVELIEAVILGAETEDANENHYRRRR